MEKLKVVVFDGYFCVVCPKGWRAPHWDCEMGYLEKYGLYAYPFGVTRYPWTLKDTLDFAREDIWKDLKQV